MKNNFKNADCGNFIGIDIGGTKTKIGYLNDNCDIVIIGNFPTCQDPKEQTNKIIECLKSNYNMESCDAIGIAAPGPLSQKDGTILSPPNLPEWNNYKITDLLSAEFNNILVKLENDANCGALGEALFGAAKNAETVLYLTISTGLGAGIVHNGKIIQGYKGLAAEIWCFDPMTFMGSKGKYNLNDLCSGNGLVKQVNDKINSGEKTIIDKNNINTRSIIAAWKEGDNLATELIENMQRNLCATVSFLINTIAPDVVVIGGGLTHDPDWFITPLQKTIPTTLAINDLKDTPIKKAELGQDVVVYGTVGAFTPCLTSTNCRMKNKTKTLHT